ncbi:MAG: hypothetical protein AAB487_00575 [Patescibacteria group bacterium]
MRSFLFLYPIRAYIDQELPAFNRQLILERLNAIINARYRQNGYQIYWLLFGAEHNPEEPDFALLEPRIKIHDADRVISAGLSLKRHRRRIYPSPKKILSRLDLASELVVGGFHQDDCVKRIARQAYNNGLKVFVDEDTTDQYFITLILWEFPPVVRTREQYATRLLWNLRSNRGTQPYWLAEVAIKNQRADRRKQPWLVQI